MLARAAGCVGRAKGLQGNEGVINTVHMCAQSICPIRKVQDERGGLTRALQRGKAGGDSYRGGVGG